MIEDQNSRPDVNDEHKLVMAEFDQIIENELVDVQNAITDLEDSTDGILNALAALRAENISPTKASKLAEQYENNSIKSVESFIQIYNILLDEGMSEEELVKALVQITYEQQESFYEFMSNVAPGCETCKDFNQTKSTIEIRYLETIKNIKDLTLEVEEEFGDSLNTNSEDYPKNRKKFIINNYSSGLVSDLEHLFSHTPQEYKGKDYKQIAIKLGMHAVDVVKIAAGAGIALLIYNKAKKQ